MRLRMDFERKGLNGDDYSYIIYGERCSIKMLIVNFNQ